MVVGRRHQGQERHQRLAGRAGEVVATGCSRQDDSGFLARPCHGARQRCREFARATLSLTNATSTRIGKTILPACIGSGRFGNSSLGGFVEQMTKDLRTPAARSANFLCFTEAAHPVISGWRNSSLEGVPVGAESLRRVRTAVSGQGWGAHENLAVRAGRSSSRRRTKQERPGGRGAAPLRFPTLNYSQAVRLCFPHTTGRNIQESEKSL